MGFVGSLCHYLASSAQWIVCSAAVCCGIGGLSHIADLADLLSYKSQTFNLIQTNCGTARAFVQRTPPDSKPASYVASVSMVLGLGFRV